MRTALPSKRISPPSGWWTPDRIFTSVDLPAPFSPMSAVTAPRVQLEARALERAHAAE